jgi:hypothetical protein
MCKRILNDYYIKKILDYILKENINTCNNTLDNIENNTLDNKWDNTWDNLCYNLYYNSWEYDNIIIRLESKYNIELTKELKHIYNMENYLELKEKGYICNKILIDNNYEFYNLYIKNLYDIKNLEIYIDIKYSYMKPEIPHNCIKLYINNIFEQYESNIYYSGRISYEYSINFNKLNELNTLYIGLNTFCVQLLHNYSYYKKQKIKTNMLTENQIITFNEIDYNKLSPSKNLKNIYLPNIFIIFNKLINVPNDVNITTYDYLTTLFEHELDMFEQHKYDNIY